MRYQSIKTVTTFMIVAILSSLLNSTATATYQSSKPNMAQPSSSTTSELWKMVEALKVPVDGSVVTSKTILKQGGSYKVRALGTTSVNAPGDGLGDAEYGDFSGTNPLLDNCYYSPSNTDIGISINDNNGTNMKRPRWGKYNSNHDYSTYMIGAGLPLQLKYHDCDHSDNSGSLRIEIYQEEVQVLNSALFEALQALIDRVPTYENTKGTECPSVDIAKAKALAAELERANALLSVYKTWTQQGENTERRMDNSDLEAKYREATSFVSERRDRIERAQKGFFRLLDGLMYPEPYPVRFSRFGNNKPPDEIAHLDVAQLEPLLKSLQSALQNFTLGAPIRSQVATTKKSFQPGEGMEVKFTSSACLAQDAWAGIVPSTTPHGNEEVNDQSKVGQKQFIEKRRSGTMSFSVPTEPGSYDVRLNDSNRNGKEVASLTFRVEGPGSSTALRTLPNLKSVVVYEQTYGATELTYAPDAPQLTKRLQGSLSEINKDFSFYEDEYYDVFYSNADGSYNRDGAFITIEGVWRQPGVTDLGGGMNINEVGLIFEGANAKAHYGDFISSFAIGSICEPAMDNHCIPNSPRLAADGDPSTFPRFGQTSRVNRDERFRLTIGFKLMR